MINNQGPFMLVSQYNDITTRHVIESYFAEIHVE